MSEVDHQMPEPGGSGCRLTPPNVVVPLGVPVAAIARNRHGLQADIAPLRFVAVDDALGDLSVVVALVNDEHVVALHSRPREPQCTLIANAGLSAPVIVEILVELGVRLEDVLEITADGHAAP